MRPPPSLLFALFHLFVCCVSIRAETVNLTLEPARDNTIFEENLNSSGAGPHLFSGETIEEQDRRLLLAFDFSILPSDAVVSAATLSMVVNRTRFGVVPVAVHRLSAGWGEGTSDSGDRGGAGVTATLMDATWRHRLFDTQTWVTEGGDYDPLASATTQVGDLGAYTWSSADLVRDVNEWLTGTRQNFGWILIAGGGAKRFHSREGAPASDRPRLELTFETTTPPAPTGLRLDPISDTGIDGTDRITRDNTPTITGDAIPGSTVTLFVDGVAAGSGPGGPGFAITTGPLADGEKTITAKAARSGGAPGQESEPLSLEIDATPPSSRLERDPGTADPAAGEAVGFRVTFSEAVGGFLRSDVNVGGTANPGSIRITPDSPFDGSVYRVDVSGMNAEGTVTASIAAGIVEDPAGNPNEASSGATIALQFERFGETPERALKAPLVGRSFAADGVLFPGDVDFVSFSAAQTVEIRISTGGSVDTVGTLFDARKQILNDPRSDDNRGGGGNYSITRVLGPGSYFVRTTGRPGSEAGDYQLSITVLRNVSLKPDLLIGDGSSFLRGDNRYNLTGSGQTIDLIVSEHGRASFRGRLENDGDADDEISLTAGSSPRLTKNLRFFIDGRNEKAALRRGTYRRSLRPGSSVSFEGDVTIAPGPVGGLEVHLKAESQDRREKDTVKARFRSRSSSIKQVANRSPRGPSLTPSSSDAP